MNLSLKSVAPIFIGESNINHIMERHSADYKKYGHNIKNIIENPTYLARNVKKNSIEYIREYKQENDFVLVAVRISNNNIHFVRTMYIMSKEKVDKYRKHNYFIQYNS